jgi:hypothetical protein
MQCKCPSPPRSKFLCPCQLLRATVAPLQHSGHRHKQKGTFPWCQSGCTFISHCSDYRYTIQGPLSVWLLFFLPSLLFLPFHPLSFTCTLPFPTAVESIGLLNWYRPPVYTIISTLQVDLVISVCVVCARPVRRISARPNAHRIMNKARSLSKGGYWPFWFKISWIQGS